MRLGQFVDQQPARMPDEFNVCGVLVHARPEKVDGVLAALQAKDGVEVHHIEASGRMIVTVEDVPGQWAGATITSFQEIEGILNFALVYHHTQGEEEGVQ